MCSQLNARMYATKINNISFDDALLFVRELHITAIANHNQDCIGKTDFAGTQSLLLIRLCKNL